MIFGGRQDIFKFWVFVMNLDKSRIALCWPQHCSLRRHDRYYKRNQFFKELHQTDLASYHWLRDERILYYSFGKRSKTFIATADIASNAEMVSAGDDDKTWVAEIEITIWIMFDHFWPLLTIWTIIDHFDHFDHFDQFDHFWSFW